MWLQAEDPRHEVPPKNVLGPTARRRPTPHLLTTAQISALMAAALLLPPKGSITPHTWHSIIGLMATTGLQRCEVCALRLTDITADGLVVRETKFQKSRLVPLHPSTVDALDRYLTRRRRCGAASEHLFVLSTGRAINPDIVTGTFVKLARQVGLRGGPGEPGPRLHDLRHRFAVRSLERTVAADRDSASRHMLALATYLGHNSVSSTYWYPRGHARSASPHRPPDGARPRVEGFVMTELADHLGVFLREHLPRDRNASRHTVQSYADSFQLLVCFAAERLGVRPCRIEVEQLTAPLILDFLDTLERERNNTIGTRNVRLAAFKSFFRYLEFRAPACLDLARQVHAIPMKRGDEAMVESLNRDEVQALLDAPDPTTAAGVRDRAMLHLTYAAGLRVSELIGLTSTDLARPHLDTVRVTGKGRRERVLPPWQQTRAALRDWLCVRPDTGQDHLFLNARGKAMTRHGFAHRLELHATTARQRMPSMTGKRIFRHLLRHSCAAHTLEATGDIRKVSLWLGHASIQSTEIYLRSDPIGKLDVLAARLPPAIRKGSFKQAPDRLLAILNDARAHMNRRCAPSPRRPRRPRAARSGPPVSESLNAGNLKCPPPARGGAVRPHGAATAAVGRDELSAMGLQRHRVPAANRAGPRPRRMVNRAQGVARGAVASTVDPPPPAARR